MSAWRILFCVVLALGFSMSVKAESSGTATIRIVVSHVPTFVARNPSVETTMAAADNFCVSASMYADPHRIQAIDENPGARAAQRIKVGGETCIDLLAASAPQAVYRIVPE